MRKRWKAGASLRKSVHRHTEHLDLFLLLMYNMGAVKTAVHVRCLLAQHPPRVADAVLSMGARAIPRFFSFVVK